MNDLNLTPEDENSIQRFVALMGMRGNPKAVLFAALLLEINRIGDTTAYVARLLMREALRRSTPFSMMRQNERTKAA